MDGLKPATARQTHWCGILNKESATSAPASKTRTVRGPYSAFSGGTQRNDETAQGKGDGESQKSGKG